ncbi:hypothetical protein PQU63_11170 [Xanthomonas protegens]|uniref:Tautomerase cis-CaaD-like domain-containing protein n=1 Tax=Xanthomonas protegens TaxID=3380705 RepID=A0ABU9LEF8_9XANT
MSISIYYTAERRKLLSPEELAAIASITERYSVDSAIEALIAGGTGLNWESFHYATNPKPGKLFRAVPVFQGATKLPGNTENATWEGVQHWCACLSDLRRVVRAATWRVAVEDHEIVWNEQGQAYDPSV